MLKIALIFLGFLLLIFQEYVQPITMHIQFIIFLIGIVILGIPHGAADLLVAMQSANDEKKEFSKGRFFLNYWGRLSLFAVVLWLSPLIGNLLFIVFAGYHFGETDLCEIKTDTITGKIFVASYGLVILGVILLQHFDEVIPMLSQFNASKQNATFINWLSLHRYSTLSILGIIFFATTLLQFVSANSNNQQLHSQYLVRFACLLFILFKLPMMLGFTFYFITWHSIFSLQNIINYLRKDGLVSITQIAKQMVGYSLLAMIGIVIFAFTGYMYLNSATITMYVFLGLAVLTAPHMQIMHDMYKHLRYYKMTKS